MPNEFANNTVSLWFYHKNDAVRGIRIKGISFKHGIMVGQGMVGKISVELNLPVWLGYVSDGTDSRIFPAPISLTTGLKIEALFPADYKPNF